MDAAAAIVGTWTASSWFVEAPDGTVTYPYGRSPQGQITYGGDGRMSAFLMNPDPAPSEGRMSLQEAISLILAQRFFSYFGTYSINPGAGTVTHHVLGSLVPSWVGGDLVRAYAFEGPDRLQIIARTQGDAATVTAGISGRGVVVWERVA